MVSKFKEKYEVSDDFYKEANFSFLVSEYQRTREEKK